MYKVLGYQCVIPCPKLTAASVGSVLLILAQENQRSFFSTKPPLRKIFFNGPGGDQVGSLMGNRCTHYSFQRNFPSNEMPEKILGLRLVELFQEGGLAQTQISGPGQRSGRDHFHFGVKAQQVGEFSFHLLLEGFLIRAAQILAVFHLESQWRGYSGWRLKKNDAHLPSNSTHKPLHH